MSSADPLARSLATRFVRGPQAGGRHIAFWHDLEGEYSERVEELAASLENVKVVRVDGDEFAVKYRLLHQEPTQSFIVYRTGEVPAGVGNWLLDLEFAYGVFTADKAALIGEDLGLVDLRARSVVTEYPKFFNAADRTERLKKRLEKDDDRIKVTAKMCAVLLKTDPHSMSELTRHLLIEASTNQTSGLAQLLEYDLEHFYWEGVEATYGYSSGKPTIEDFVLWLFRSAFEGFPSSIVGRNVEIDYSRWRDATGSKECMETLAKGAEEDLQVSDLLETADWRELLGQDTFALIDQKIISELAAAVAERTISPREVRDVERERQSTFWYRHYQPVYTAIRSASDLFSRIEEFDPQVLEGQASEAQFDAGLALYAAEWMLIDQLYRNFMHARRSTEHPTALEKLAVQVENFYTNKFVGRLATAWQVQVDGVQMWGASQSVRSQRSFFSSYVQPQIEKGKRVAVIISDALRFEAADELAGQIRHEDKFDAHLEPVLGVLPSYTQLGMAALLPHDSLGFTGKKALTQVDGYKTDGTANRSKILELHGGAAIQAEDIVGYTRDELRAWCAQYKFSYIYHNRIDSTGDKLNTERQVFSAVANTINDIVALIKKLASADISTVFITADHGFLFQDSELAAADFLSTEPHGEEILDRDRRRVIGRGLKPDGAFRHFTAGQLGLSSDYEVLIPKGTKRLKLQGSGTRFVHGGATLQEVVVPVITVSHSKTGKSDIRPVAVVIQQKVDKITTGILAVDIHQVEPVSDKVHARELRAGVYFGEDLISTETTLKFNSGSNESRERYVPARLSLRPEADTHNNKDVELRLEEQLPKTNQWRVVAKAVYRLKRSFQADF